MSNKLFWICIIKNIVALICFTVLAIVFHKWWIILFALLFMSSVETKHKSYSRVCDGCGKHSPYADSYNQALEEARLAGWVHITDTNKDYCPQCRWAGMNK